MSGSEVVRLEVDCHAYAWHLADDEYPETGPDNLTRMAEEYGVLVRFLPDHAHAGWAWWYEIVGPREHLYRLILAEYAGEESQAREMSDAAQPWSRSEDVRGR